MYGYSRVVHDHVIERNAGRFVFFRDATEGVKEQTITKLHDVGLVHASDFL